MSSDSPDSEIRDFYNDASLPDERIDAILSQGRSVADARLWKRVAMTTSIGLASMVILCGFLLVRLQGLKSDTNLVIEEPINASKPVAAIEAPSPAPYRLIAVRSHGDRCPNCRTTGETFAELRQQFQGRPIEFMLVDFKNSENTDETNQKLDALNISKLLEGRRDKALLALADSKGAVHELDMSLGTEQLGTQIVGFLEQD